MRNSNYILTGALATAVILPGIVLGANDSTVKIKSGDTLSEIAKAHGMTVSQLKELNGLKTNTIYINQILKVKGQATPAVSAQKGTITNASHVNIRAGAGMQHKAITALKKGTEVIIHKESAGWSHVTAGKTQGYVATSFIQKGEGTQTQVSAPTQGEVKGAFWLNIREGAGMQHKSVGTLKQGTKVTIHGNQNGWYSVTAGDKKGFVASNYITTDNKPGTQQTTPAPATKTPPTVTKAPAQAAPASTSGFIRPTETTRITSNFGSRWGSFHYGTDWAAPGNQKIMAAASGTVTRSWVHPSWGEVIFIKHNISGKTYETIYAHLRTGSRAVKVGDKVQQGQFIGWMGSTGYSTGQHLHFEVHPGGYVSQAKSAVDPLKYVK